MRRRFLALAVPTVVTDVLVGATASLRAPGAVLRATDPAGWHVTLAYLGEVDDVTADLAVDVTAEVLRTEAPRPAPRLHVTRASRFGDRVLVAELGQDPPDALTGTVRTLHRELTAVGVGVPEREWRPHITLARASRRDRITRRSVAELQLPRLRWRPQAVGRWASTATGYVVEVALAWPSPPSPSPS